MFGRKNQTILSSHYGKLVDRDEPSTLGSNVEDKDGDEDFFSLKRADHDLPTDHVEHLDFSKRKIRMMKSRKALVKAGPKGTKLVFDDDGQAHAIYEFRDVKDVDVERDGGEFMKKEIGKMQRADIDDRAVAKEKKRERKRKRKEKEREEVSVTTTPSSKLNNFILSWVATANILVLELPLLQTTTATFPRCLISRPNQRMIKSIFLPHRGRNLAESPPLHWRRRRNLRLSSYDDEDLFHHYICGCAWR